MQEDSLCTPAPSGNLLEIDLSRQDRHPDPFPGAVVDDRYRLLREIGAGGGGVVFEAEHVHTAVRVALKMLNHRTADDRRADRLLREARLLGPMRHPNVVRVYDAGSCQRYGAYLTMALVRGRTLESFVTTRGRLDPQHVVAIVGQLADALTALDVRGIVHGDVKPSNVLVSRGSCGEPDRVVLIDFGVAKQVSSEPQSSGRLTCDGDVLGTPEYMAPEQVSARASIDHRADVYGLGALAYECLTGVPPFSGNPVMVMTAIVAGARPQPISRFRQDVPPALELAIERALDTRVEHRWPSAGSFARACAAAIGCKPKLYVYPAEETLQDATPSGSRRRRASRAPYIAPGRIALDNGVAFDCRIEDISTRGLLVISPVDARVEGVVDIKFPLPMSGTVIRLRAIVRWVRPRHSGHALGLELTNVPQDAFREIEAYLGPFWGAVSI